MDASQASPSLKQRSRPGCRLEDYAARNKLSIQAVWDLIEDGSIRARQLGRDIIILTTPNEAAPTNSSAEEWHQAIEVYQEGPLQANKDENNWQLGHFLAEQLRKLQSEMTHDKRQIIAMQGCTIDDLKTELQDKDRQIRQLQQKIEDLNILTNTLSRQPEPPSPSK